LSRAAKGGTKFIRLDEMDSACNSKLRSPYLILLSCNRGLAGCNASVASQSFLCMLWIGVSRFSARCYNAASAPTSPTGPAWLFDPAH
jgi:hypothetical protein